MGGGGRVVGRGLSPAKLTPPRFVAVQYGDGSVSKTTGNGTGKNPEDGRGKAEGSMATQKRGNAAVQQARVTRLEAERRAMPDDPAEATLAAMRHVAHMPTSRDKDTGHLVGLFRAVQKKNPVKFAEMLIAEEGKAAERNASKCRCCGWADSDLDEDGNPPPEQERIADMDRTRAAMRPIHLKRIQEEKAKEAAKNAELAARPTRRQRARASGVEGVRLT